MKFAQPIRDPEKLNEIKYKDRWYSMGWKNASIENLRHGYVYFVISGDFCKIGYTFDLKARIRFIATNNPLEISVIHTIKTADMWLTENLFHELYKEKRVKGEWFQLDKKDIQYIKKGAYTKEIVESIGKGFPIHKIPDLPI